jgi:predicted lysophospholipase L1 biosynthesis ABC-type transport system permease subunit
MTPSTLLRLALAGTRTDLVRVVLTGVSALLATLALLAAANVLAIRGGSPDDGSDGWSQQYLSSLLREPGLRPGVALALVLLTIPVLALAGQCARLGAPARDRRLAAIRLAGATPAQTTAIAVAETAAASALGSALGLVAYLVGRRLAHRPNEFGQLPLPTDVLPPAWGLALVCLSVPALAAATAILMLRRVTVGPFGVVRRTRRTRAPRPWPALLIALGFVPFVGLQQLSRVMIGYDEGLPRELLSALLVAGALLAALGVVLGTGWLSYAAGRALHRLGRSPAALLAARRLLADPWNGSRTLAAVLTCALVAGGAVAQREYFEVHHAVNEQRQRATDEATGHEYVPVGDMFYLRSMDLVDLAVAVALVIAAAGLIVAVAESIVSRRRTYAALVATGVPRGVLARSVLWQSMTPAVPAIGLALAIGTLMQRATGAEIDSGTSETTWCDGPGDECEDPATAGPYTRHLVIPGIVRAVPVPLGELALAGGLALLAVLATVGVGLLFLRSSTTLEEMRAS